MAMLSVFINAQIKAEFFRGDSKSVERNIRLTTASGAVDFSLALSPCWVYKTEAVKTIAASDNAKELILHDESIKNERARNNKNENEAGILISLPNGKLEFIDVRSGERIWISDLGGEIVSNLAVGADNVFLVIKSGGNYFLKSIAKVTGITAWQTKLSISGDSNLATIKSEKPETEDGSDGNTAAFLTLIDAKLTVLLTDGKYYVSETESGQTVESTDMTTSLNSLFVFDREGFFSLNSDSKVLFITKTGKTEFPLDFAKSQITAVAGEISGANIYFGDRQGNVGSLKLDNGKKLLWSKRAAGAQISDITPNADGLLISSFDNFVYFLSKTNGRRIWKKRLPARIASKPLIESGYAVIPPVFSSTAFIIDLKNGRVINRIGAGAENYFTGGAIFVEGKIVLSTSEGLTAFSTKGGC